MEGTEITQKDILEMESIILKARNRDGCYDVTLIRNSRRSSIIEKREDGTVVVVTLSDD